MNFHKYGRVLTAGLVLASLSFAPALAQNNPDNPAAQSPPAASTPTPAESANGVSPQSSSEMDKPNGPVADKDVFGFDISMGAANLTAEQKLAATNTCRDNVTIDPVRYSSAVKSFCDTLK